MIDPQASLWLVRPMAIDAVRLQDRTNLLLVIDREERGHEGQKASGKQAKGFRQDTRRKRKKGMVKLDGPESISGRLPNTNFVELNLLPFHRETELRLGWVSDAR